MSISTTSWVAEHMGQQQQQSGILEVGAPR